MSIQYQPLPHFGATITATDDFRTGYKAYTGNRLPPDSELQTSLNNHVDNYIASTKGHYNLKDEGEITISGFGSKESLYADLIFRLPGTDDLVSNKFYTKDSHDTVHERTVPDDCVDRWINYGTAMLVRLIDERGNSR
jgi:hypothetical protein